MAVRPGVAVATGPLEADASVELRRESEPLGPTGQEALAPSASAVTVQASGRLRGAAVQSEGRVAYRRKRYDDDFRLLGRQDAESVALRLSSRALAAGGAVDGRVVYDALTERSPILQETYVLVGHDLGEFVWRDGQGEPRAGEPDGVAQVDEFFPETTPLEGTYVRTFLPGTDLFPTVGVGLGLTLSLRAGTDRPEATSRSRARSRPSPSVRVVDMRERTRERDVLRVLLLSPSVLQSRRPWTASPRPSTADSGPSKRPSCSPTRPPRRPPGGRPQPRPPPGWRRASRRRLTQSARAEAFRPVGRRERPAGGGGRAAAVGERDVRQPHASTCGAWAWRARSGGRPAAWP